MFGENSSAGLLLTAIDLGRSDFPGYCTAFLSGRGRIGVYCTMGKGQCENPRSEHKSLLKHPDWISYESDRLMGTYWFTIPDAAKDLVDVVEPIEHPNKVVGQLVDALRGKGDPKFAAAFMERMKALPQGELAKQMTGAASAMSLGEMHNVLGAIKAVPSTFQNGSIGLAFEAMNRVCTWKPEQMKEVCQRFINEIAEGKIGIQIKDPEIQAEVTNDAQKWMGDMLLCGALLVMSLSTGQGWEDLCKVRTVLAGDTDG